MRDTRLNTRDTRAWLPMHTDRHLTAHGPCRNAGLPIGFRGPYEAGVLCTLLANAFKV